MIGRVWDTNVVGVLPIMMYVHAILIEIFFYKIVDLFPFSFLFSIV